MVDRSATEQSLSSRPPLDRKRVYTSQFNSYALVDTLPAKVMIFDTTLRDGEQTPGIAFSGGGQDPDSARPWATWGWTSSRLASRYHRPGRGMPSRRSSPWGSGPASAGWPGATKEDIDAVHRLRPGLRSHLHRHIRHPPAAQAEDDPASR